MSSVMPIGPASAASMGSGTAEGWMAAAAGMAAPGTMPGAAWGFREARAEIERERWWETV